MLVIGTSSETKSFEVLQFKIENRYNTPVRASIGISAFYIFQSHWVCNMSEEYEKSFPFAGIGSKKPAMSAKAKERFTKLAQSEKLAAALGKKKKAAKKAASAKATANRQSAI